MTEKELDRIVCDLARTCGWLNYHTHDSRRSPEGFPDRVLVRPPRVIFAELKGDSEYGKRGPDDRQKLWLSTLGACPGVETYLWTPADINEITAVLSRR